jgi:hypothetical protein|tara:strand:- start:244 stop:375 length:132 start_codon:yes stop_codon:yes gene_type:complete
MAILTANAPTGVKKKRKGIHSKTKTSQTKSSKNYKKLYKGQGR